MAARETTPSELEKRNIHRLSGEESNRISRECLRTALIQLLSEEEFQKISVTELTKRAGVSRATFYRNYGTKEGLLEEIVDKIAADIQALLQTAGTAGDAYQSALQFFRRLKEKDNVTRGMMSFRISLSMVLAMPPLTERKTPHTDAKTHYWRLAFDGAVINITKDWVVNGMQQSPEEMADIYVTLFTEARSRLPE
ncbi:MAG: TetR/AcrR family transcriptional regulator [Clostridiales bacterium]|nr:TetR/AcrR family transcriptional regulator [Clostridiales bacterium]